MFVIQLGLGAELTKQATRKKQIAEIRDETFARKRDKIAGAKSRKVPTKFLKWKEERGKKRGKGSNMVREEGRADNYATCEAMTCARARTTRRTVHACSAYDNARRSRIYDATRAQRGAKRGDEEFAVTAGTSSEAAQAGGFSGWTERSVYGSQSGKWRTQGNHARIPLFSPVPESEFYVLHTDENTCATARDTRFLSRSSPCHFPSSALSSALTPFEAFSGTCWKTGDVSNVNFLKIVVSVWHMMSDLVE